MPFALPTPFATPSPGEGGGEGGGKFGGPGTKAALPTGLRLPICRNMDNSVYFSPTAGREIEVPRNVSARFAIGDVVRHKMFDFRGVIFDIDPVFANSEEWYESIPKDIRPDRDQPFYHLFAENDESNYVAYVSQQNLLADPDGGPVEHPEVPQLFDAFSKGRYKMRRKLTH